jgi:hypothetical protein
MQSSEPDGLYGSERPGRSAVQPTNGASSAIAAAGDASARMTAVRAARRLEFTPV